MAKMNIFLIVISPVIINLNLVGLEEKSLINHVKNSIAHAQKGISKLNYNALSLEGMSSPKVRHLLNNLCSLPDASYLEIGVWKGSTLIAALLGNTITLSDAIAIDNWSEFQGPHNIFKANVSRFLPENSVRFYDQDCFAIDLTKSFNKPINIYFYDGNHTAESQRLAFTYYNDIFADVFIAIVDDWNHEPARIGTRQAFEELKYTVLFEEILPANYNGDTQNWWNGLYVAVIKRNN